MSVNDPQTAAPGAGPGSEPTGPTAVAAGHGWQWIAEGFGHFKRNPWAWIGAMLVWFILVLVMSIIPVVGALATMLLTFVFVGGFMIGCREQAEGRDFTVGHLFAGFSNHFGALILLSVVYTVISLAVMGVALGDIYFSMLAGTGEPAVPQDPTQFLLSFLIALAVLIPVWMLFWFAPVLVVNDGVPAFRAMKLSFIGCLKNIIPLIVYGLIALVLYAVALIPIGLGLLILVPTLFASMFTAYRDIYHH